MPVPAAKVKALCSSTEAELVRNSRPPQLKALSLAEVKQAKARARKLADKWQGQGHKQARAKKSTKGESGTDPNTALKAEIFRDALSAYEARQTELEAKGAKPAAAKKAAPTKKARAASHRGTRATIRNELALVGEVLNRGAKVVKKTVLNAAASLAHRNSDASAKTGAPSSAAEAKAAAKPSKKAAKPARSAAKPAKKGAKTIAPAKAGLAKPGKAKQVRVATKAKQSKLAVSGKTSRVVGHVSASGKRSQARRDSGKK